MDKLQRITEQDSRHRHLEKMSTLELLQGINSEDLTVPAAVGTALPDIAQLVDVVSTLLAEGGRLFYLGAGTSGRLGILDASECPPTFGVENDLVIGLIAGGDRAIRNAVENAEDNGEAAKEELIAFGLNPGDFVLGLSASGTAPYVLGAMAFCRTTGVSTGCITCNPNAPLIHAVDWPVCVVTGPEFLTGSTRMKAGTAQKLVLNMISTSVMIKLGRVKDNKMIDMKLSNAKLIDRGARMIQAESDLIYDDARDLLIKFGSVRRALLSLEK
jgi:N-acetylmuramic acid 6-phosphate etherase